MPHTDPQSTPLLSRSALDRDAPMRHQPEALKNLIAASEARFVLLHEQRMLAEQASEGLRLVFLTAHQLGNSDSHAFPADLDEPLYLGRTVDTDDTLPQGTPVFAIVFREADVRKQAVLENSEWIDLRTFAHQLNDRDAGIFTTTLALAHWNETAGFSADSGAPTRPAQGGWARIDSESGAEIFPRTDPAVIVLITDADDRVLLGANILWPENRYSLLAGFVEAGESVETAVHREIFEEAGIELVNLDYRYSQPWPFPRSLMLGFRAQLSPKFSPDQIRPDETELVDLRWFTREELRSPDSTVLLPGEASIARFLLDEWMNEESDN